MVLRLILIPALFVVLMACSGDAGNSAQALDPAALYGKKCSLCHGNDGKLQLAGATDLSTSTLSLEEAMNIISNGKGNMTPFKDMLSETEIQALAEYILTLRQP